MYHTVVSSSSTKRMANSCAPATADIRFLADTWHSPFQTRLTSFGTTVRIQTLDGPRHTWTTSGLLWPGDMVRPYISTWKYPFRHSRDFFRSCFYFRLTVCTVLKTGLGCDPHTEKTVICMILTHLPYPSQIASQPLHLHPYSTRHSVQSVPLSAPSRLLYPPAHCAPHQLALSSQHISLRDTHSPSLLSMQLRPQHPGSMMHTHRAPLAPVLPIFTCSLALLLLNVELNEKNTCVLSRAQSVLHAPEVHHTSPHVVFQLWPRASELMKSCAYPDKCIKTKLIQPLRNNFQELHLSLIKEYFHLKAFLANSWLSPSITMSLLLINMRCTAVLGAACLFHILLLRTAHLSTSRGRRNELLC